MKCLVILLLLISSAFASDMVLLLDASCKVSCLIQVKENGFGQSGPLYEMKYGDAFVDYSGLSRQLIEANMEAKKLSVCQRSFGTVVSAEKMDCLFFKN